MLFFFLFSVFDESFQSRRDIHTIAAKLPSLAGYVVSHWRYPARCHVELCTMCSCRHPLQMSTQFFMKHSPPGWCVCLTSSSIQKEKEVFQKQAKKPHGWSEPSQSSSWTHTLNLWCTPKPPGSAGLRQEFNSWILNVPTLRAITRAFVVLFLHSMLTLEFEINKKTKEKALPFWQIKN